MAEQDLDLFHEFFASGRHLLEKGDKQWPTDRILFQLGYEHAEDSPVTRQAEQYLKDGRVTWPWLKQLNRKQKYERNPNYMTLTGHTTYVEGVHLLANERALSYSGDSTLRLWNLKDASSMVLMGHTGSVDGVQLSDNERALSYSHDTTLRLWNLKDGSSQVFEGHTNLVRGVQLLDNERALSWSDDSTIRLWCLSTQKPLNVYVFEGINKVYDIGNNKFLCFANNGRHRFLEIMDNELKPATP